MYPSRVAMKMHLFQSLRKTTAEWKNNSEPWRSGIALRLKSPDVLFPRFHHYNVLYLRVEGYTQQVCFLSPFYSMVASSEEKRPSTNWKDQLVLGSSLVRNTSKHTWMWWNPSGSSLSRKLFKEQYLGSLKEPLNKSRKINGSSSVTTTEWIFL